MSKRLLHVDRSSVGLGDLIVTTVFLLFLPGRPRLITRASTNITLAQRLSPTLTLPTQKNRSAMRTWGLILKFIPFGWNAVLTYQCLEAELLQAKR